MSRKSREAGRPQLRRDTASGLRAVPRTGETAELLNAGRASTLARPKTGDTRNLQKRDNPMTRPRKVLAGDTPNERFGIHLQTLLHEAGLSVADLKARLDSSPELAGRRDKSGNVFTESGIRKWLRGERTPDVETLFAIAVILKLPDWRQVLPPLSRRSSRKT